MRGTPARGPPVICLLDSSSSDEDDIICTGVVTATDREGWARSAAVELDSSQEPSESPLARAPAAARRRHHHHRDGARGAPPQRVTA